MHDTLTVCIQVHRRQLQVNFKIISPQGDVKYFPKILSNVCIIQKKREQNSHLPTSGLDVGRETVVRAFHHGGLQRHHPRKMLCSQSATSMPQRLKLACVYLKHGDELWKSDLWSDETKLLLFGNMDVAFVW